MEVNQIAGTNPLTNSAGLTNSQNGLVGDFDNFLSLLTAQLQNQDPLEPTDSSEFTRQLVSFAGVEQQLRQNANLETLQNIQRETNLINSAGFLGQTAVVESDVVDHTGEGAKFQYGYLGEGFSQVVNSKIEIINKDGDIVFEADGTLDGGLHDFEWDGTTTDGKPAPDGLYRMLVKAKNENGDFIDTTIFSEQKIRSVQPNGGQPVLELGSGAVGVNGILRLIAEG